MSKPSTNGSQNGRIMRIAGPVVGVADLQQVRLYDVVHVGEDALIGEVIRLDGTRATVQVYEETSGLQIGEPVRSTQAPLVVELGPGLLGTVYDGLQRPLRALAERSGAFLARGQEGAPLDGARQWSFRPQVKVGDSVEAGYVLGCIPETESVDHHVLVPAGVHGRIVHIAAGQVTLDDVIAVVAQGKTMHEITLRQRWPVRRERPYQRKLMPDSPLITGTRIIDTFCPVAKGGTAIIPGGFGTGKTVIEQALARWADVDVVIYIGCGERGNEMAEVLREFPELEDPRTGAPLMSRTILIANTSNMPVAAREASIYTGITLAEYYRDMGYDVLLLADSTSRWGEALREISGRLEEMPGEEGFPAYLAARLAEFYERSGRVQCGSTPRTKRTGSVTIIGAVSPPGGDFSEPVTQNSLRVAGTFWALDYDLSRRRHFPAINWLRSYTLYDVQEWYVREAAADWPELVQEARSVLQQEEELLEIVQLIGPDTLGETQRALLAVARMLREDYLQQSAFDPVDRFCPLEKMTGMLRVIITFHHQVQRALAAGQTLDPILAAPVVGRIARMKELPVETAAAQLADLLHAVNKAFATAAPTEQP